LVATSRLYMKAHTNFELFVGSMVGILPQLAIVYINENHQNVISNFTF